VTRRWWKRSEPLYRRFAPPEFSGRNAAEAEEMFRAETHGGQQPSVSENRYAAGKRNLDATVAMWYEDIRTGMLLKYELLSDPTFLGIQVWVRKVLSRVLQSPHALRDKELR